MWSVAPLREDFYLDAVLPGFESSRMNTDILRIQIWQRPMWLFIPLVSVATSCDPPTGVWVPDAVERHAPGRRGYIAVGAVV